MMALTFTCPLCCVQQNDVHSSHVSQSCVHGCHLRHQQTKTQLFLMVVKDGNGETYIGNVTIIQSQKQWVFIKIYQTVFLYIYGQGTVSRFQLAVTDDDVSAHGPFDYLIKTTHCYSNCTHILCVFHGLIMMFHTDIYPLLPHKKGTYVLTKKGELYGKLRVLYQIH